MVRSQFHQDGFFLLPQAVDRATVSRLRRSCARLTTSPAPGLRGLLGRSRPIRELAENALGLDLAAFGLETPVRPLRALLFDKSPAVNWKVGWHQDTNLKDNGQLLVSNEQLFRVFTLRLHLDPTPASNGALRALRGSHLRGRQPEGPDRGDEEVTLEAGPGDVLLMRPLLFHASSPSERPSRRRVLHIDYLENR